VTLLPPIETIYFGGGMNAVHACETPIRIKVMMVMMGGS